MSAEATVVRNYLDWLLGLPLGQNSKIKTDLNHAEAILDGDHFGLDKVRTPSSNISPCRPVPQAQGPISPDRPARRRKTSLAKSIAKATGRGICRMALGGVRDEAEIRGHRRTISARCPARYPVAEKGEKGQPAVPAR